MRYALIQGGTVANVVDQDAAPTIDGEWVACGNAGPGWAYSGGNFTAPVVVSPTEWLIDVGPFFDRFGGAAKMAVLTSANATVQALVKDLQIRKWIDLQRADVAAGIDALIALGVAGVDGALKTAVLTTPVAADENEALRKVYFS